MLGAAKQQGGGDQVPAYNADLRDIRSLATTSCPLSCVGVCVALYCQARTATRSSIFVSHVHKAQLGLTLHKHMQCQAPICGRWGLFHPFGVCKPC